MKRRGVLGTPGGERLYTQALVARGIETVLLEGADREAFMALVYGVKRGDVGEAARAGMLRLAQALADAGLPAGVLNLVFGRPAEISAHLIASPIIRKVSFTGSVPVGKLLAEQAARCMKPCTMELGGHAPVMVFADMDPIDVAQTLVQGKFRNAGQVCISPTRFYVEAKIYDQVVEAFVAGAEKLVVGDGLDPRTEMGQIGRAHV